VLANNVICKVLKEKREHLGIVQLANSIIVYRRMILGYLSSVNFNPLNLPIGKISPLFFSIETL